MRWSVDSAANIADRPGGDELERGSQKETDDCREDQPMNDLLKHYYASIECFARYIIAQRNDGETPLRHFP